MARILTGIQSTGTPHLGNVLGAIRPAIELAQDSGDESFLFIADLHSLTQIKDGAELRANTYSRGRRMARLWTGHRQDRLLPPERRAPVHRTRLVPELLLTLQPLGFGPQFQGQSRPPRRRECRAL